MSQNLLSNVFKPRYVYDSVSQTYATRLELVNIDTLSANTVSAFTAAIGDSYGNAYFGLNSGNAYSTQLSNSKMTAVGVGAGQASSNSSNSVFLGYEAGKSAVNSSNTIAIGASTIGSGSNNIYIGTQTGTVSGGSNIFIGQNIAPTNPTSNMLLVGQGSNYAITADMSVTPPNVGLGTSTPSYTLDVNGYASITGALGINSSPYEYTFNLNGDMRASDGYGVFTFSNDGEANSLTTIDVTGTYSGGQATLAVTGGFFSAKGVTDNSGLTLELKKGTFMVSAYQVDSTNPSITNYQGYMGIALSALVQKPVVGGDVTGLITANSGSSVTIASNTTWTITYFPSA